MTTSSSPWPRRRRRRVAYAVGVGLLVVGGLAPDASAARSYTRTATARATVSVVVSATATETVTASGSAGTPPGTATATATASARASAEATATATARRRATGRTKASALRRARSSARAAARALATRKARALARSRALRIAADRARADALARARQAAATKAATSPQATPAEPCGGSLPAADGHTYGCTFDEEFNGTALDPAKWQVVSSAKTGRTDGPGCFVDSPDNVSVSGGALHLSVGKVDTPFKCTRTLTTPYTSGQVGTAGRFYQTYGRFLIRAKFPDVRVKGLQTSLWLWPENNLLSGLTGEIDIAEWYSYRPDYAVPTFHYQFLPETVSLLTGTNVWTTYNCQIGNLREYHTYGLEWTKQRMTITFDDHLCLVDNYSVLGLSPFDQPFFVALSAALGQTDNAFDPAVTPLPDTTDIDWVRVWKLVS